MSPAIRRLRRVYAQIKQASLILRIELRFWSSDAKACPVCAKRWTWTRAIRDGAKCGGVVPERVMVCAVCWPQFVNEEAAK